MPQSQLGTCLWPMTRSVTDLVGSPAPALLSQSQGAGPGLPGMPAPLLRRGWGHSVLSRVGMSVQEGEGCSEWV